MRKMGLLVAALAATFAFSAGTASAISLPPLVNGLAKPLCEQQGGAFYVNTVGGISYSCRTDGMNLFSFVKGKVVCSLLGGSFSVSPLEGYRCTLWAI